MKRTVVVLGFLAAVGSGFAQDVSQQPAIELPKFVVTDDRMLPQPESWRYATIPGFEILTNASDKATKRMIRDFEMFRQALSYVWPVPTRFTQSTSLIICGRGGKFDKFVPAEKTNAEVAKASLFKRQGSHAAIVIDLQATTLNVLNVDSTDDAATGTDSGLISVDHDKQLYREYVRYLMSQSEPRSPAWLEEGLSQIIMKMEFDKRYIEFAKLEDPNTVSAQAANVMAINALNAGSGDDGGGGDVALPGAPAEDRDFAAALRRRPLVAMDKFFAVTSDSPEANNVLGNNRWAKQAYAFVHMCLYGNNGKFQKAFMTFLQRSAREPVNEAMFKECFKMSYKDMLMEIRGYCDFTVYKRQVLQPKTKSDPDLITVPPALALREATQAEIGRIKADALILFGHNKEAWTELHTAYVRGERDPDLLAALGVYDKANGEPERARKFLENAYIGKTKRADAMIELARERFMEVAAKPGAEGGQLSAPQVESVLGPLKVARANPPPAAELYDLAGEVWMRAGIKPTKDDARLLIEGAQLYPTRLKLVFQAGLMVRDAGEIQAAHALADHGIRYAPETAKKRFQELKDSLPPNPAPPPAEAAAAEAKAGKKSK